MQLRALLLLTVFVGASFVTHKAVQSATTTDRLFRSTGPEVRFRCGSELIRAKLRGGRLVVRTASGERAFLSPMVGPGAVPQTSAYGDGRLTLYKVRDPQVWALARADRRGEPAQRCTLQRQLP